MPVRSPAAPPPVSAARLKAYRAQTFRLNPRLKLRSEDDAVRFVEERGFVYFWPIKGVEFPSLWTAVAGDRPVADKHDDPGHVTWGWKDRLLGARRWYYAKVLRGKATMIALPCLKYFYALSDNFGDQHDYLLQYQEGRLSQEAKLIYETLLEKGALHTVALRRETRLGDNHARFDRALTELQAGFKIVPIGVAQAGAWRYSFIYELVDRYYPNLAAEARPVGRGEARACLADGYLQSLGAASLAQLAALFGWKPAEAAAACTALAQRGRAAPDSDWWLSADFATGLRAA